MALAKTAAVLCSAARGQPVSNLAVGSLVKLGRYQVESEAAQPVVWMIAAKNHSCTPAYPANSVTLITQRIIDLRCMDAAEPNNAISDRKSYGNNRYSLSNMDQWLNRDSAAGAWFSAAHSADQAPSAPYVSNGAPYSGKAGFLALWKAKERDALLYTSIRTVQPDCDGGGSEDTPRRVYLPSLTELLGYAVNSIYEGAQFAYFKTGSKISYPTQQLVDNSLCSSKPSSVSTAWYLWVRSGIFSGYRRYYNVTSSASSSEEDAYSSRRGIRPCCNISGDQKVSLEPDGDGCYTLA